MMITLYPKKVKLSFSSTKFVSLFQHNDASCQNWVQSKVKEVLQVQLLFRSQSYISDSVLKKSKLVLNSLTVHYLNKDHNKTIVS